MAEPADRAGRGGDATAARRDLPLELGGLLLLLGLRGRPRLDRLRRVPVEEALLAALVDEEGRSS
jgi:hypothetical protein